VTELLAALPACAGHFRLESGYHTDLWLTLDGLFVDPAAAAPLVDALARKLAAYDPAAICGSLVGGAFLAQALAASMGLDFYFTEPIATPLSQGLFTADYRLPAVLARRICGVRAGVVDDVISAGSSARATVRAVRAAGGEVVAVGALMTLGSAGVDYFAAQQIPLATLERRGFNVWAPGDCPLCRSGRPLEDPPN
jgi:orotate phosphoribosyltransferase